MNVNIANYDISDHIPVVCGVLCEKTKNKVCYQRSVQDVSILNVIFLNNLNMTLRSMRLCMESCVNDNECWNKYECIFSSTVFSTLQLN